MTELVSLGAAVLSGVLAGLGLDRIVVVRHATGIHGEHEGAVRIARSAGRVRIVQWLRGILDSPDRAMAELARLRRPSVIKGIFAAIWVHGDPSIHDPVAAGEIPFCFRRLIQKTGYLAQGRRSGSATACVRGPCYGEALTTLLRALEDPVARPTGRLPEMAAKGHRDHPPVPLHGDFSTCHILVSGTSARVIDVDWVRTGEPAADIGSFSAIVQIRDRRTSGPTSFGEQAARLIESYHRYQSSGRGLPARIAVWSAYRLFLGRVDPFRDRAGCWRRGDGVHIRRGLEMIL